MTRIQHATRLLRTSGFLIDDVHFGVGFAHIVATRIDNLGVSLQYVVGIVDAVLPDGAVQVMRQSASHHEAALVVVSDHQVEGVSWLGWADFLARFGGVVSSLIPLQPEYSARLIALGSNQRPPDLPEGAVDRLYELYVGAGLEFLLGSRVIRYGSERLFEPVPDGVALPIGDRVAFLYDGKSAAPSFEITRDDIRRFGDYVRRFNESYAAHAGPVRSLVVASTEFGQDEESRRKYSQQLVADAGVPISFLKSQDLADIVGLLSQKPWMRTAIRWREILTPLEVTSRAVREAIATIEADSVKG